MVAKLTLDTIIIHYSWQNASLASAGSLLAEMRLRSRKELER
jgi:hypothetical protein